MKHVQLFNLCVLALVGNAIPALAQNVSTEARQSQQFFKRADKNQDGVITQDELPKNATQLFSRIDKNKDGNVTPEEDIAFRKARQKQRNPRGNANRERDLPEGATVHKDLIYATVKDRELPLDLYLPADRSKPVPVVMWIHGGGWKGGKKASAGPARPLVGRGYAVVDVEYRLSGEAIFPAQVEDCKAAVRWIRANAKKYNFDGDHIGVWGSSAGGHLAAFLGTSGDVDEFETESHSNFSSRVQAVCDWYGPTDLLRMNEQAVEGATMDHDSPDSPESRLVGGPIQKSPFKAVAVKANPMTYVTKDDPPFLIVHGDRDLLVSHRQSMLLQDALEKAGVKSTLTIIKNGGHGFGGNTSRGELFEQAAKFFETHLKPGKNSK